MACSQQAVHVGQDRISLTVGVLHPDLVMESEPYPSPQQVIRYALDGVNATEANPLSVSAMASALMMVSCHLPRYRCHLGCILLKMAAISSRTGGVLWLCGGGGRPAVREPAGLLAFVVLRQ